MSSDMVALLLNGPTTWYENVFDAYKTHGRTWLQQNKNLDKKYYHILTDYIANFGYFYAFGYVQGVKKVNYLFRIDNIVANGFKVSPPDHTVPDFSEYDVIQGKCEPGVYKYLVWLRVVDLTIIDPLNPQYFTNAKTGNNINPLAMKPLRFYVELPQIYKNSLMFTNIVLQDLEYLEEEEEFFEGKKHKRLSNYYERNPKLRAKCIEIHGTECKVCGFDFKIFYGNLGKDYIEVHHKNPVSQLTGETLVDPEKDMTVLCSNCHRMIHRSRKNKITIDQLKEIIKKSR